MSVAEALQSQDQTAVNTRRHLESSPFMPNVSTSDKDELQKIDAAYSRIATVIPDYPYVLSAPVDVEPRYHHQSSQDATSWAHNTPFAPHEERLQFMTFVYREPGESCLVVKSHVDEERERLGAQKKQDKLLGNLHLIVSPGRPSTPLQAAGAAKKKISFGAYKDKLANIVIKETSPEQETSARMDVKEARKSNGLHRERSAEAAQVKEQAKLSQPAKRPLDLDKHSSEARATDAKRARLSPVPSTKSSPSLKPSAIDHLNGAPHGLPALLSPTNPFQTSPRKMHRASPTAKKGPAKDSTPSKNPWNLPDMLSPTLPPQIEAELAREARRGKMREEAESYQASSDASSKRKTPASSAQSSAQKQKSAVKLKEVRNVPKTSHAALLEDPTATKTTERVTVSSTPGKNGRKRLLLKLKFGKRNTRVVRWMLKFPSRKNREYSLVEKALQRISREDEEEGDVETKKREEDEDDDEDENEEEQQEEEEDDDDDEEVKREQAKKKKKDEQKSSAAAKVGEKRPRSVVESDAQPAGKKAKVSASLDVDRRPKTPIPSAAPSPGLGRSGGSGKSHANTPAAAQLKAVAMVRLVSNDTPVSTPGARASHAYVPPSGAALQRSVAAKGPTSVPNGARAAEIQGLVALSQHYNQLGRKLKHENQAINSRSKEQQAEPERKRAALLGLECILAYMIAFASSDSSRRLKGRGADVDATWKTLLPLFRQLRADMAHYRHLDGLHCYLGIAINSRIAGVITDRMSRSINPGAVAADSPQSTIENAANGSAESNATKTLVDAVRALMECSREAACRFSIEDIQRTFKSTWDKRWQDGREGVAHNGKASLENELLVNDKGEASLSGKYPVPIGIEASPIQAVRFGVAIIKEFIRNEELGYEPRVRI